MKSFAQSLIMESACLRKDNMVETRCVSRLFVAGRRVSLDLWGVFPFLCSRQYRDGAMQQ
jgi:hypothetical protein